MSINKLDAEDEKILREYANMLPVVMENTHEVHRMTGAELLEMGYVEFEGEVIDPEKKYRYNYPIQIAANHYRRLKRAWIKEGELGIDKYIKNIAFLMQKNKEICMSRKLHWAIILRNRLLIKGKWKWNAFVRDITAFLELKFRNNA